MAGLHAKYEGLRRTSDGSEVEGWYFVLRDTDPATHVALLAYADACDNQALAEDLRRFVADAMKRQDWARDSGLTNQSAPDPETV